MRTTAAAATGKSRSFNYGAGVDQGWHVATVDDTPREWGVLEVLTGDNTHKLLAGFQHSPKPVLRVLCRYGLTFRTLFTRYALPSNRPRNRSHDAFAGKASRFIGSAVEVRLLPWGLACFVRVLRVCLVCVVFVLCVSAMCMLCVCA